MPSAPDSPSTFPRLVGRAVERVEDAALLTGRGRFADDVGGAARHRPRRGAALAACTCRDRLPRRGRGALDARGRHRPDRRGHRCVVPAVHRRGEAADAALRTCGRSGALHGGAGGARPLWGRRRARTDRGRVPRARPGGRSGRRGCARRTAAAPRGRLERRERPALALRRPRRCVRERRAPGGDLGALSAQCVHADRGVRRRGRTPRGRRLRRAVQLPGPVHAASGDGAGAGGAGRTTSAAQPEGFRWELRRQAGRFPVHRRDVPRLAQGAMPGGMGRGSTRASARRDLGDQSGHDA